MSDPWKRKGKMHKQNPEGFPVESPLTATSQRIEPDTSGLVKEAMQQQKLLGNP